jgi:hypothetical protein
MLRLLSFSSCRGSKALEIPRTNRQRNSFAGRPLKVQQATSQSAMGKLGASGAPLGQITPVKCGHVVVLRLNK